jgi:hypothetical protein
VLMHASAAPFYLPESIYHFSISHSTQERGIHHETGNSNLSSHICEPPV